MANLYELEFFQCNYVISYSLMILSFSSEVINTKHLEMEMENEKDNSVFLLQNTDQVCDLGQVT